MEEEKLKFKEIKESDEDEQVEKTEINALGKGVEEMTSKMSDLEEKKTELEPKPQTEAEQMKEVDKGIKERHSELLVLVTSKLETLLEGVEDATPLARKGQLEEALPYMDESTLCSRKAYDRFREWNNITFGTDMREIEMVPDLEDETPYWQHLRKNSSWLVDGIFVVGISAIGAAATQSYKGLLLGPAASLLEKTILLNHQRQLRGRNKKRIREETAMYNSLLGLDPKVELEGSLAVAKHRVQSILKDREGELINYGQLVTEVCSGHDWTRERNVTEDPTVLAGSQAARIVYHSLREIAKDERFIVELKGPQHVHVCTEIKYRANTELDPARSSLLTALNARGEQVSS